MRGGEKCFFLFGSGVGWARLKYDMSENFRTAVL